MVHKHQKENHISTGFKSVNSNSRHSFNSPSNVGNNRMTRYASNGGNELINSNDGVKLAMAQRSNNDTQSDHEHDRDCDNWSQATGDQEIELGEYFLYGCIVGDFKHGIINYASAVC